jgi:hypothetical protein
LPEKSCCLQKMCDADPHPKPYFLSRINHQCATTIANSSRLPELRSPPDSVRCRRRLPLVSTPSTFPPSHLSIPHLTSNSRLPEHTNLVGQNLPCLPAWGRRRSPTLLQLGPCVSFWNKMSLTLNLSYL